MKKIVLFFTLSIGGISSSNAQTLSATSFCPGGSLVVSSASALTKIVWQRGGVGLYTATPTFSTDASTAAGDGTDGSGPGQLSSPQGIWLDGNGAVYVADYSNSRVQKWAPGATAGVTVAGTGIYGDAADQLSYPTGLYVDAAGNVYVTDANNNRVQKWAPGATSGITVAGDGTAGSDPGQLNQPFGVCVDAAGNVYVADASNHRIQKWAPGATSGTTVAGTGVAGSGANQLCYPQGICVDGNGNIYIADNFNNRIQKWAPGANTGTTVAGYADRPSVVHVDIYGNLYVDDQDVNGVRKWVPGATSGILVAGTGGYGSGPDQLTTVAGVYVDSIGRIYISDNINNRIQKYGLAVVPSFTATTGGNYSAIVTTAGGSQATNTVTINTATSGGNITGPAILGIGSTITLTDNVAGGSWSASNDKVTVADGMVTGISNGGAMITYTTDGICGHGIATKLVTVGSYTSLSTPITAYYFYLCEGGTAQFFDATAGGTWSINPADAGMASVSGTGMVSGISAGAVRLSYTLGTSIATAVVTVFPTPAAIAGIASACQGLTTQLSDPTFGGVWSSAIPSVATVSNTGLVTTVYPSVVPIYYTIPTTGCRAIATVIVNANPAAITGPVKVCTGLSIALTDATPGGTWSTSNTRASIDAIGNVAGISAGSATITYTTTAGCIKALNIIVNQAPSAINGNLSVCAGSKTFLSDATTGGISWVSSNSTIATVSGSGVVTGVSAGSAFITYTISNNCTVAAVVSVNPTPQVSQISGASSVANHGNGIVLSDNTTNGVWTSSNQAILTVGSGTGLVTAHVSAGSAYINYIVTNSFGCSNYVSKLISCTPPVQGRVRGADDSSDAVNEGRNEPAIIENAEYTSGNAGVGETTSIIEGARLPMSITVQPNPNSGKFRLMGTVSYAGEDAATIEITNMIGQLVYSSVVNPGGGLIDQQITTESLPNGSYILNVKKGEDKKAVRFVISR